MARTASSAMTVSDGTRVSDRATFAGTGTFGILLRLGLYCVLLVGGIVTLVPYLWMLSGSFKDASELFNYPPRLLPSVLRWENYYRLFAKWQFGSWALSSLTVSISQVVLGTFLSGMAGFGFAKYDFKGRKLLFTFLLGSMMLPFWVYVVPLYVLMIKIGWLNTYRALVIPWIGSAFGIFLCRQYMLTVPSELLDAARIDGASELRILIQIGMPLSRPALGAVAIVLFLSSWNSFFWPLVILRDQARYTIPVGLALLSNMNVGQREWGPLMAGSVLASLPIIVVFLFMQRQFISGMVAGAVKT